eukprot:TRINITY_DN21620_c0_g1_i1.p1 TRINITY_DN21620_c0_g1~~TRINITY_DN21620_c0_g1_i1.p1  ORF type:complete len:239 (-),score=14.36 TRINITY_DN21620_c0_g1_i1:198-914(-)
MATEGGLYPAPAAPYEKSTDAPTPGERTMLTKPAGGVSGGQWSNGLFHVDPMMCLYAFFCPTCAVASARTEYDQSNWCFNCLTGTPVVLRNIVREGYGIEGDCVNDILMGVFCGCCSTVQATLEIKARGGKSASHEGTGKWSDGQFDCLTDPMGCLLAAVCPMVALAQARTKYDQSNCIFNCLCLPPAMTRSVIREGYDIEGTCVEDLCCTCLPILGQLEAARVTREVERRGPPRHRQ